VGALKSVEGGTAVGEVVTETLGPDNVARKHLAGVSYEELTLQCGADINKTFLEWVKTFIAGGEITRKDGAILFADFNSKLQTRLDFQQALITEVAFPACDAANKDAGFLTVKLAPELTVRQKGRGEAVKVATESAQKRWLPSNFRLTIPGLDTSKVSQIHASRIKRTITEEDIGDLRDPSALEGLIGAPNLGVTLAETGADTWHAWLEDFVIEGNNDEGQEKTGRLEFLTANSQAALFTLNFHNLGIYALRPPPSEASSDAIARVKADLYCERMEFGYPT